jgi:hypothetical protein
MALRKIAGMAELADAADSKSSTTLSENHSTYSKETAYALVSVTSSVTQLFHTFVVF